MVQVIEHLPSKCVPQVQPPGLQEKKKKSYCFEETYNLICAICTYVLLPIMDGIWV
jgi:hypothetical protein